MQALGNPRNCWHVSKNHADLRRQPLPAQSIAFEAQPQSVTLDLAQAAIVVIDMQNDFCSAFGWLDYIGVDYSSARKPIEPLVRLLPVMRQAQVPVIWLNWGNRADRMNLSPSVLHVYNPDGQDVGLGGSLPESGSRVLEKGSWGAAVLPELKPKETDVMVDKYRMSGFWDTPLDSILRNLNVRSLFFAGVNMDQCVMATLQDAVCLGYDAILLQDCSATTSPEFCAQATIYNVNQCYGFTAHSQSVLSAMKSLTFNGSTSFARGDLG